MKADLKGGEKKDKKRRWLIITKGIGFAPAVNLSRWSEGKVDIDFIVDTEKVSDEIVRDYLYGFSALHGWNVSVKKMSLADLAEKADISYQKDYDRVMIMASDYYIKTLSEGMKIPPDKLVFSNNFRMCCGEGICGACSHIDKYGNVSKMCKCRSMDVRELL